MGRRQLQHLAIALQRFFRLRQRMRVQLAELEADHDQRLGIALAALIALTGLLRAL